MTTVQRSILDYLNVAESFGLSSRVTIQGEECIAIGLDNGNDAAKITMLNDGGKAISVRIPTAYRLSKTFQGGQGEVTYQLSDDAGFWIGEAAIRNEGRALRVGSTATRIADARHAGFLAAALVEALIAAGFAPEHTKLAIGFAVPNSEIVKESADSEKLVVCEETKNALRKHVRGNEWAITRTDERGRVASWSLTVRHLIPQAQSVGTFVAWAKAPNGATVTDYDALTILDIGGGDLQQTDISLKPYRMSSERRGDGTIDIARGLKELLPKAKFNDVTAQYALVSRQALISGKMQKIVREVDSVINSYGQDLVGKMLEIFQNTQRYMIITGGGVILLQDTIIDLLNATGLEAERDYFVVNHGLASVLNSTGALFSVLFMAAKTVRSSHGHQERNQRRPQPKEPRITVTKGIRLTGNELTRVRNLLSQYPECASEAELLRQATLLGVYVLAAQATGQPAHGGYQPGELVALLKYRVLPAIDFLFAHDAYPALYRTREIAVVEPLTSEATGSNTMNTQIVPNAAGFLGEIGTGFMDD